MNLQHLVFTLPGMKKSVEVTATWKTLPIFPIGKRGKQAPQRVETNMLAAFRDRVANPENFTDFARIFSFLPAATVERCSTRKSKSSAVALTVSTHVAGIIAHNWAWKCHMTLANTGEGTGRGRYGQWHH